MTQEPHEAKRGMEIGAATDIGNVRELNEDTILAMGMAAGPSNPLQLTAVLMVADGVGGHDAGEVASKLAGETVHSALIDRSIGAAETLRERLLEAVAETNARIHACAGAAGSHPATTLTLCACRTDSYTIVHVGDSRAYLVRGENARQITEDDSWVGEAVRRGQMTADEAEVSPFRNQLTKSVGSSASVDPTVYEGDWRPGDVLVLTSDGLTEYVHPEEISKIIRNGEGIQAACEALVRLASERGGHDNISVVAASSGPLSVSRKPPTAPLSAPVRPRERGAKGMAILVVCLFSAAALLIGLDLRIRHETRKTSLVPTGGGPHAAPAGRAENAIPRNGGKPRTGRGHSKSVMAHTPTKE